MIWRTKYNSLLLFLCLLGLSILAHSCASGDDDPYQDQELLESEIEQQGDLESIGEESPEPNAGDPQQGFSDDSFAEAEAGSQENYQQPSQQGFDNIPAQQQGLNNQQGFAYQQGQQPLGLQQAQAQNPNLPGQQLAATQTQSSWPPPPQPGYAQQAANAQASQTMTVKYVTGMQTVYSQSPQGQPLGSVPRGQHVLVRVEGSWAITDTGYYISLAQLSDAPIGRIEPPAQWR